MINYKSANKIGIEGSKYIGEGIEKCTQLITLFLNLW